MDENEIVNLKYSNCCRICLTEKNNLKDMWIANYDDSNYLEIYRITCISDTLPIEILKTITTKICPECETKLILFYEYRKLCHSSEKTLDNYLNSCSLPGKSEFVFIKQEPLTDFAELDQEEAFDLQTKNEPENSDDESQKRRTRSKNTKECDYCKEKIQWKLIPTHIMDSHTEQVREWRLKYKWGVGRKADETDPKYLARATTCNLCGMMVLKSCLRRHMEKIHSEPNTNRKTNKNNKTDTTSKTEILSDIVHSEIVDVRKEEKVFENSEVFDSSDDVIKDDAENTIQCEFCPQLVGKRSMKRHLRDLHRSIYMQRETKDVFLVPKIVNADERIVCHFCSKDLNQKSIKFHYFNEHAENLRKNYESDELIVSCEVCCSEFKSRQLLVGHYREMHADTYIFLKIKALEKHESNKIERKLQNNLNSQKNKLKLCEICGLIRTKEHLQTHTEIVGENAQFPCNICGAVFKKKNTLLGHKQKHKFANQYPCRYCSVVLKSWHTRRNHEDEYHRNIRRYPCNYCEMEFINSDKRTLHTRRAHTGGKPFKCKHCEKCFFSSGRLKSHNETHEPTGPHPCNFCNRQYSLKRSLAHHIRTSHKAERDAQQNDSKEPTTEK